jgi:hypothetical protein
VDIATIIEDAVTEKLERLEAKRFGKTKNPKKSIEEADTTPSSRYIPTPVRRAVYARDNGQCTYVDVTGRRCSETKNLEFHHIKPFGRGGDHDPSNIRMACRTHNILIAEHDYGKDVMEQYRHAPDRTSEPAAVYTFNNRDTRAQSLRRYC